MSLDPGDENIKYLYKYRADNDRTLELLQTQELYFSFPDEFNDPFDCKLVIDTSGTDDDIKKWLEKMPHPPNVKKVVFDQIKKDGLKKEIIENQEKQSYKAIILYCLSTINDNSLMWSHYSNSHEGICIGFKTDIVRNSICIKFSDNDLGKLGDLFNFGYIPVAKVEYSENRPIAYSLFRGTSEDVKPFLLRKDKCWAYESERRINLIYPILKKKLLKVAKSSIGAVYLGSKIKDDFKVKVLEILKKEYLNKGFEVQIFSSQCSRTTYELEFEEINL